MPPERRDSERRRLAQRTLELVRDRGSEVPLATLAAEEGISRHRLEEIFEDEDDLTEAVAEVWLEPHVAIMEEVVASDLPSNRKMYEFIVRRFRVNRDRFRADPSFFAVVCELGAARFERVRSFVDLADHYLCEIIAQAQDDGYFAGLEIDQALSLINQMVSQYTWVDSILQVDEKLSEEKLARIIDTIFIGLSSEDGGARGVNTMRLADG